MNLIEILLPKPGVLSIVCKNNIRAFVQNYTNINIDFSLRSEYHEDGSYHQTEYPFITYTIKLNKLNKKTLYTLFENNEHKNIIQEKQCIIFFGKKYKFKSKLIVVPSILDDLIIRMKSPNSELNKIKLELNLEKIDKKFLYKDIKIAYKEINKKFTRFELMDI